MPATAGPEGAGTRPGMGPRMKKLGNAFNGRCQAYEAAAEDTTALADASGLPTENLLPPDSVRRISWEPPDPPDPLAIEAALSGYGARRWQVELTAGPISAAIEGAQPADTP